MREDLAQLPSQASNHGNRDDEYAGDRKFSNLRSPRFVRPHPVTLTHPRAPDPLPFPLHSPSPTPRSVCPRSPFPFPLLSPSPTVTPWRVGGGAGGPAVAAGPAARGAPAARRRLPRGPHAARRGGAAAGRRAGSGAGEVAGRAGGGGEARRGRSGAGEVAGGPAAAGRRPDPPPARASIFFCKNFSIIFFILFFDFFG